MKRFFTLGLFMMFAFAALAQKNVTQFLGIPIDGTKSAMIQKLKAKGFTYNVKNDAFTGQFNGRNVILGIETNNNKVYRIVVVDAVGTSESDIKIRFNRLCNQFENNGKYFPQNLIGKYTIEDDEDISYEMTVNNKRFQAAYFQVTEGDLDTTGTKEWAYNRILEKYGEEKWIGLSDEERATAIINISMEFIVSKISHKSVWFMITQNFGEYSIAIFYDNELNQANGEDL